MQFSKRNKTTILVLSPSKDARKNITDKLAAEGLNPDDIYSFKDLQHALNDMPGAIENAKKTERANIVLMPSISEIYHGKIRAQDLQLDIDNATTQMEEEGIEFKSIYASIIGPNATIHHWSKKHSVDELISKIIAEHSPQTAYITDISTEHEALAFEPELITATA